LRAAATDETTVTDVAMRYGFWQLGGFCRRVPIVVCADTFRDAAANGLATASFAETA
jgi:hypothetical protein